MDLIDESLYNKRPQSLPVLNVGPTSPVAKCCSCAYLSKSTSDIFRKKRDNTYSGLSSKKKCASGSKLLWSAVKRKVSSNERIFGGTSDVGFANHNYLRSTSWTFVKPSHNQSAMQPFNNQTELSVPSEKDDSHVITPTYQTFIDYGKHLQQSKTINAQNGLGLLNNCVAADVTKEGASEPNCLLKQVLTKTAMPGGSERRYDNSNIPRSPGPLDGSPYAQVKKKKSSKSNNMSLLSANRGFHSEGDVSFPSGMTELKVKQQGGIVSQLALPQTSQSHVEIITTNTHSEDSFPPTKGSPHEEIPNNFNSNSGYQIINYEKSQPENLDYDKSESRISLTDESKELPTPSKGSEAVVADADNKLTKVEEKVYAESSSSTSSDISTQDKNSANNPGKKEPSISREAVVPPLPVKTKINAESDSLQNVDDVMNEQTITSSSSSDSDMRPHAKKQLTKEEVRDAVALINECLSDQELRSGSLTPADSPHAILKVSAYSAHDPILAPQDRLVVEPDLPPAQPDYYSKEMDRPYGDKSPEYALPDRDVIHKSVPMRTAQIRVQENVLASAQHDKYLDNDIISMVASKSPTVRVNPTRLHSNLPGVHNSSVDSGRGSRQDQADNLRKTTSSSDVDSGIDGSTLINSAKSDVVVTPVPESNLKPSQVVSEQRASIVRIENEDISSKNTEIDRKSISFKQDDPLTSDPSEARSNEEEDEEEKRVREEIENTQKRLVWLQEQQNKLKKQKEDKSKRHSFGYNPTGPMNSHVAAKTPEISATLPRPPGHHRPPKSGEDFVRVRKPSPKEQKDLEELLRSAQELDFAKNNKEKREKDFSDVTMTSASVPIVAGNQLSRFHETPINYRTAESKEAKNTNQFTPAYAHPMHQPQRMGLHHYQLQNQEELRRNRFEERRKLQQEERNAREQKKKEIDLQEKRREDERALQEKFEMQFEQKQKQLQQETKPQFDQQQQHHHLQEVKKIQKPIHKTPAPSTTFNVPAATTTQNSHINVPGSSMTLPSPRKHGYKTPPSAQVKSDELQSQLDELDLYIAQLTQNMEATTEDNSVTNSIKNSSKNEVVLRRRSFSIEIERKMDPNIPLSPEETESQQVTPPKPPARSRSSFDSVSRRLSHGFELAQIMRQQSMDKDAQEFAKDDDVFAPAQPSYPPQTRHTRPIQQQIIGGTPPIPKPTPQKIENLEENLSPQLFLAMSVNPGARPVEEIHSYKEDLDPSAAHTDAVDGAQPATPQFPVSPATPYVNAATTSGHIPAGLAQTPLSALGLKPLRNPDTTEIDVIENVEKEPSPVDVIKQQVVHINGATSSMTSANSVKGNFNARLESASHQIAPEIHHGQMQLNSPDENRLATKSTLLSNHSHDSGYADTHQQQHPSNGWVQNSQVSGAIRIQPHTNEIRKDKELKSPWVYSGGSSPQSSTPGGKSPGPTFAYPSTSADVSSNASRSLTGSNDSLLSNGSSSSQPHFAYQQQRFNGSQPSPPNKDSSLRNSGSSIRSTSTGSGYLGGTSRTSPHSAGSPASSAAGQYPLSNPANRRESQLSSYDKQGGPQGHHVGFGDEGGLSTTTSGRTSSSSTSDADRLAHDISNASITGAPPKFIKDTTSYWYKPDVAREQALAMLRDRPPGSFVVRDSRCYPGAFGLALKVHKVPAAVLATAKPGTDMNNELVRHFLIEPSSRGVKLKGCINEPVFGSLSALIYQHSITPLALPCKLVIPTENQEIPQFMASGPTLSEVSNTATELLRQGAACNVAYLSSIDTESLTGPEAIERAMREVLQSKPQDLKTSVVHFKVSPQGITLTDNARKIFFRRHYPTNTVTYCGVDPRAREPHNRRWNATNYRGPTTARVFGFVAKKPGSTVDNVCHLFAELDMDQPAPAIVNFVSKVLIGSG